MWLAIGEPLPDTLWKGISNITVKHRQPSDHAVEHDARLKRLEKKPRGSVFMPHPALRMA